MNQSRTKFSSLVALTELISHFEYVEESDPRSQCPYIWVFTIDHAFEGIVVRLNFKNVAMVYGRSARIAHNTATHSRWFAELFRFTWLIIRFQ